MLNWFIVRLLYAKGVSVDSERNKALQLTPAKLLQSLPASNLVGYYVMPSEGNNATASHVVSKIKDTTENGATITSTQTLSPKYANVLWREPRFSEAPFPFLKNWCNKTSYQSDCKHVVSEIQRDFRYRNATQSVLDPESAQPLEVLYAQCQRNIGILRLAPTVDNSTKQKEKLCREHVVRLAELLAPSKLSKPS